MNQPNLLTASLSATLGVVASVLTIYQFLIPIERDQAYAAGAEEIASYVVQQLSDAGFDTQLAGEALQNGETLEAVSLATQATKAPLVAIVPDTPFILKEREVIDLPSGEMLSYYNVSSLGKVVLNVDGKKSNELYPGDMAEGLTSDNCVIDVLEVNYRDEWSKFRRRCQK